MELIKEDGVQMELKYCERCGGLWLRLRGSEMVYCPPCAVILAGIARDPRFLQHWAGAEFEIPGNEEDLENTFWSEGGQA